MEEIKKEVRRSLSENQSEEDLKKMTIMMLNLKYILRIQ